MSIHASLRKRLVIGVVCFTTIVTVATSFLGHWFDEQAEQRVWEAMFRDASAQPGPTGGQAAGRPFLTFGAASGKPLPVEFSSLSPGIHDDMQLGDRTYVVDVEGSEKAPVVLALDITDMERRESNLDLGMLIAAAFMVLILIALTYALAQWLVKPLAQLSTVIGKLQSNARGQQIEVRSSDPAEVVVIARAVNAHLQKIDGFVAREREFLNMASHELRTPLAVISGAAEVANEQATIGQARAHIERIIDASRSMHDLLELLLALARHPERLKVGVGPVNLADLIPRIVADHEHLLERKELAFVCGELPTSTLSLPRPIAESVIGNLIRNAIENSSRGTISISVEDGETLVISGPGSTMSPVERSQLQSRLARAGMGHGGGIGLELVERLCHHVGWILDLEVGIGGVTTARLGFRHRQWDVGTGV